MTGFGTTQPQPSLGSPRAVLLGRSRGQPLSKRGESCAALQARFIFCGLRVSALTCRCAAFNVVGCTPNLGLPNESNLQSPAASEGDRCRCRIGRFAENMDAAARTFGHSSSTRRGVARHKHNHRHDYSDHNQRHDYSYHNHRNDYDRHDDTWTDGANRGNGSVNGLHLRATRDRICEQRQAHQSPEIFR